MVYVKSEGVTLYLSRFADFRLGKRSKMTEYVVRLMLDELPSRLTPGSALITADLEALHKIPYFKTSDLKESKLRLARSVLYLLESFGLVREYELADNRLRCTLTALGEITMDFVKKSGLSIWEKASLMLIPGLLFKSKARVLLLSILAGAGNLRDVYNSVSARYFSDKLRGAEKVAFEILEEIVLTSGGSVSKYITGTQIALYGLSYIGLIQMLSIKEFKLNHKGKFISPAAFLTLNFEVSKGDYMGFGVPSEEIGLMTLDEIKRKYKHYGNELLKLIDELKKTRRSIEVSLEKFYALPYSL